MINSWLYVLVFALAFIWGSYGLPATPNPLRSIVYSAVFALAVCFAVVAMMHFCELDNTYRSNYHMH